MKEIIVLQKNNYFFIVLAIDKNIVLTAQTKDRPNISVKGWITFNEVKLDFDKLIFNTKEGNVVVE